MLEYAQPDSGELVENEPSINVNDVKAYLEHHLAHHPHLIHLHHDTFIETIDAIALQLFNNGIVTQVFEMTLVTVDMLLDDQNAHLPDDVSDVWQINLVDDIAIEYAIQPYLVRH